MMKKLLLLMITLLLLAGCDSKNENMNTILEDNNDSDEKHLDVEDEISEEENYLDYLQEETDIFEDEEIVVFIKDKFTPDGKTYIVIGIGQSTKVERIFVLRNDDRIELIDEIDPSYFIDALKLIKLEGSENKYIYCGLTNSVNLYGFLIYSIVDGELIEVVRDASGTGAGFSELFDNEDDGYINGYTSNRWSYDVLYHETFKTYLWDNSSFKLTHHSVDVGEYPTDSKDLVSYFIELQAINDNSIDIDKRLKEIFPSSGYYSKNTIEFQDILNSNLGMEDYIIYSDDNLLERHRVIVTNGSQASSGDYKYIFEMYEEFNKWHIMKIELVE